MMGAAKRVLDVLVCALLAVAIAGAATKQWQLSNHSHGELRIVVWRYHLIGQEEYYQQLVHAFESAHPRQRVVVDIEDWTTAHDKIRQWIATGDGPDMTVIPDVWLTEFGPALDPYADRMPASFLQGFDPVILERSRLHGHVLGLVWAASTKVLFYRTDLFEKAGLVPPSNWQELLTSARALSRPGNTYGIAIPGAPALDTADSFYLLLWSDGGRLLRADGRSALNSPQGMEALSFLRDLALKYRVTEPDAASCDRPCAEELFASGKAAMVETGPWLIRTIAVQSHPVPFGVVPLPSNKERATQLVTDHLVLFARSQKKNEAMAFVRFAYQPRFRLRWAQLGMVPELISVEHNRAFISDPVWRTFVDGLRDAHWIPLVKWQPIDLAISHQLSAVLSGNVSPANALTRLSTEVDHLLKARTRRSSRRGGHCGGVASIAIRPDTKTPED